MMQVMAPLVAKAEGIQATDYRDVLKALKKQQLGKDNVVPWYHEVIGKIEDIIRREDIVTLPQRKMQMRLASEAETPPSPRRTWSRRPSSTTTASRARSC